MTKPRGGRGGHTAALLFLGLRALSAGGALINGFALTYGLARTLDTHLFAVFAFVGNLGVALWLFDLGLARVLYIRMRAFHVAETLWQNRLLKAAGKRRCCPIHIACCRWCFQHFYIRCK